MSRQLFDQGGAAFELGAGCILVDHDSPDRMAARAEPLHEDDEDFDPDLAPCDDGEMVDLAGVRDIPRDAIQRLVLWLIPAGSRPCKRWRIAQLRLAIIAHMVDKDGIARLSFEDLSKELNCSRAILSHYSLRLIDGLGIDKALNGKSRRSREVYRKTAIESHRKRGHKMSSDGLHTAS